MKIVAIVTAGGSGERLPGDCKKQFRLINDKPIIAYSIDPFYNNYLIDNIVVTVPKDDLERSINMLYPIYPEADIAIIEGGKTRQNSVLKALRTVSADTDIVLIHDGVRPLLSEYIINELLEVCNQHDAVIPVHKVKNTLKKVSDKRITETVSRKSLFEAYTPQVFNYRLIFKYHKLAEQESLDFTDDSAILEHYGIPVYIKETSCMNIKITDRSDFEIVETLIQSK